VNYLNGPRGAEYRKDSTGVKWYIYDGLGSVIGEVDSGGNVTYTAKYDVYGSIRGSTGSSTSKHKFCGSLGHTSEGNTGLIYMRARYMDPVTGRFISEDPGKNGNNWYTYCNDNPVNLADQSGQFPQVVMAIVAVILLIALVAEIAAPFFEHEGGGGNSGEHPEKEPFKCDPDLYKTDPTDVGKPVRQSLNMVNELKSHGSFAEKVGASIAEILVYENMADNPYS
jgi:RHS repeat-associated protein